MQRSVTSNIMPRTTVDIDASILRHAKQLARAQGKSLSQIVSELLAAGLARREGGKRTPAFAWRSKPMKARVDLEDKEAIHAALDRG